MAKVRRRELADGSVRWDIRVFIGREKGPDGKERRRYIVRTFERKHDADAEARRLERMKDMGGALSVTSKEPLRQYLARWLDAKEGDVRARTIYDYRGIVARYIERPPEGAPPIGSVRLDRLTPDAFEQLYTWMRERGLAPRTIRYLHAVLRQALGDAVAKRALPSNPTDHAKVPKRAKEADEVETHGVVPAMDEEQAARFLEAARSDRYFALWAVLLTGGLRPSEALGLQWPAVDFKEGRVHIKQSLTRRGVKGWKIVPVKTKKGRRTVPLPDVTMRALKEWKRKQAEERLLAGAEYEAHGFVFATPFGQPLDLSNLHRGPWNRVMAAAGLGTWGEPGAKPARGPARKPRFRPAFRLYDLRHTCATLLLKRGVSPKIVQERLGHASITLTLDTYSHVLPDMQESAAAEMEAMFGAGS